MRQVSHIAVIFFTPLFQRTSAISFALFYKTNIFFQIPSFQIIIIYHIQWWQGFQAEKKVQNIFKFKGFASKSMAKRGNVKLI
jgi:hypothetical protein